MLVRFRDHHPVADAFALQRELDRIFRGAFGFDWRVPTPAPRDLEVARDANGITIRAELPGIEPSKVSVTVENRVLTIRGERNAEQRSGGVYRLRERSTGNIAHSLQLSDELDPEAITAEYRDGVLSVRVPRRAAAQPRQIEIKSS